jgi:hypothetical protein
MSPPVSTALHRCRYRASILFSSIVFKIWQHSEVWIGQVSNQSTNTPWKLGFPSLLLTLNALESHRYWSWMLSYTVQRQTVAISGTTICALLPAHMPLIVNCWHHSPPALATSEVDLAALHCWISDIAQVIITPIAVYRIEACWRKFNLFGNVLGCVVMLMLDS